MSLRAEPKYPKERKPRAGPLPEQALSTHAKLSHSDPDGLILITGIGLSMENPQRMAQPACDK